LQLILKGGASAGNVYLDNTPCVYSPYSDRVVLSVPSGTHEIKIYTNSSKTEPYISNFIHGTPYGGMTKDENNAAYGISDSSPCFVKQNSVSKSHINITLSGDNNVTLHFKNLLPSTTYHLMNRKEGAGIVQNENVNTDGAGSVTVVISLGSEHTITLESNSSASGDAEHFGYFYNILYTSEPTPQPSYSDIEHFGYFYKILYSNATDNGSGFVIPHSTNYFYIAAGLAVFFPVLGFLMYKWRLK